MNRPERRNLGFTVSSVVLCGLLVVACASQGPAPASVSVAPADGLAGTTWRLVEFQSSDDGIGTVTPDNPNNYTMTLEPHGRVALRLNCNRGTGNWTAMPTGGDGGSFGFGPLALTRAFCAPPSLDGRIARDAEYVRSYVLRGGRLYLNLMADGGTYVWEPGNGQR